MRKLAEFLSDIQDNVSGLINTKPLATFSIQTMIFIVLRLYFPVEPLFLLTILIAILLIWLNITKRTEKFITIFLCAAMLFGVLSSHIRQIEIQKLNDSLDGQNVQLVGTVASVPERRAHTVSFFFDCENIFSHYGEFEDVKVYVKSEKDYKLKYGDKIALNAYIESAENANIKLANHFLSKGAPFIAEKVTLLKKESGIGFYGMLTRIRNYILDVGNRFFTGDTRELFKALTAGDRTGFSVGLNSALNKSGLSHIACVSGLHVSILGMAVLRLLRKRGRIVSTLTSIGAVYAFAFITGLAPSALRAAIMFTSFAVAKLAIRENDSFTALSFSAMMLAVANAYVIYDWGFILSFASVFGIQVFSKFFKELFGFLPDMLSESISVTMAAQLMTIPILANMFGYISNYSVFSNIIISMIFLWVLYSCFIFVILSFIPWVNWLFSVICTFGLDMTIGVARLFADLPASILMIDRFDLVEFIVYYSLVFVFIFRKRLSAYFVSGAMLACAVLLFASATLPFDITHKYNITNQSEVYEKGDKVMLIARDSLWEIEAVLDDTTRYIEFDDVIIQGDVTGQEGAVINMRKQIDILHLEDKWKNSTFAALAERAGCRVQYYSTGIDFEKYTDEVLKKGKK